MYIEPDEFEERMSNALTAIGPYLIGVFVLIGVVVWCAYG